MIVLEFCVSSFFVDHQLGSAVLSWLVKQPHPNGINYQPQLVYRISEPSTVSPLGSL